MNNTPQNSIYHEEDLQTPPPSYCPACGASTKKGQSFCTQCGTPLHASEPFVAPHSTETPISETPSPSPKKKIPKWKIILPCALGGGLLLFFCTFFLLIGLIILFAAPSVEAINFTEKTDSITIQVGDVYTLQYAVTPPDANISEIEWTSSNSNIATVNHYGEITAKKRGTCTITVTVDGKSDSIDVTVRKDPDFKKIYNQYANQCASPSWLTVGADNSYLFIDTNPYNTENYSSSDAHIAIKEINTALGLPDSLYSDMMQTSWALGRQSQTFTEQGVTVSWIYHPNKGMEVTYSLIYS